MVRSVGPSSGLRDLPATSVVELVSGTAITSQIKAVVLLTFHSAVRGLHASKIVPVS